LRTPSPLHELRLACHKAHQGQPFRGSSGALNVDSFSVDGSPADFGELIAGETGKWGRVVRRANIKPD
jgi:hypothetical protein